MTSSARGSYPHPVLDDSDDVDAKFEIATVSVTPGVNDVEIKFRVRLTEPYIRQLITEGKASYSFRWSCSSTIALGLLNAEAAFHHADGTTFVGWIDQESIRGKVRIEFKVVATQNINNYRLDTQHLDYGSASFNLLAGDVLADAGFTEFAADKLYDPLSPPIGSCFQFNAKNTMKRGIDVNFMNEDYVMVNFPPKLLEKLGMLRERQDLQIGLVVLPALMETINFIRLHDSDPDAGDDLTDFAWYQTVKRLMPEDESLPVLEVAQRILDHPIDRSLNEVSLEEEADND